MKIRNATLQLAASDVSNHLACRHLTSLDLEVARGNRGAPNWQSPDAWVLKERGLAHEDAYLRHLRSKGLSICDLREVQNEASALAETTRAMHEGVEVIAQAVMRSEPWFGRADVLMKVPTPSNLGEWSYEVHDCKLALATKATTLLQLCLYSELLADAQGVWPEQMWVVPPNQDFRAESYRVAEYNAYYRYIKSRVAQCATLKGPLPETYPEPTAHCDICKWWEQCDQHRRGDDHLSLVAGISRLQRRQLEDWNVSSVMELSVMPLPLEKRPDRGSAEGYERVREQARVQIAARANADLVHEILPFNPEHGFCLLPEPDPGDVFFDLEADPFVEGGGREFLFGFVGPTSSGEAQYACRWAFSPKEEREAFEWFIDLVMALWSEHPGMHIYHFSGYEPGALKRLMGRYRTREEEVDRLLRGRVFVDLHTALRRAIRASVEEYSLKAIERFYDFRRAVSLTEARMALTSVQHGLELNRADAIDAVVRQKVQSYNADDCWSTLRLRDWLEAERIRADDARYTRPAIADGAASENVEVRQDRVRHLEERLRDGISDDRTSWNEDDAARWLMSDILDWHWREAKAGFWEKYRLLDLPLEEYVYERSAIGGLAFVKTVEMPRKIPTDRYRFAKQEVDIREGDDVNVGEIKFGKVVSIDIEACTVDIVKTGQTAQMHPPGVFKSPVGLSTKDHAECLFRLGSWIAEHGVDAEGPFRAARDLLLRRAPRIGGGSAPGDLMQDGEAVGDAAIRIVGQLDHSILAVQGPPGSGKTYTGSRMILELIRQGKRVGVTATSHKVIRNLLEGVTKAAKEEGFNGVRCVQKVREINSTTNPSIRETTDNQEVVSEIHGSANLLGGTTWLWAREGLSESVDVLFIDEAGQMSLANVLAVAQAAKSIVLLGDPQQLDQPSKGSHPDGADASALEHLLAGAKTIRPDMGLFLNTTWRMHPKVCEFTSEAFYEGRLQPQAQLIDQKLAGHPWLGDAGLWLVPVEHFGNQNASSEEVEVVEKIVRSLVEQPVSWTNKKGEARPLSLDDVLVVAPYNAQVSDLSVRIGKDARVGTVDKFQGQEAPVVIYSLTTSSPEDAPRGMEFLFSLNRLNVATSRAQGIVIVVASPLLFQPDCKSPRQMQLANALCRYAELASEMRVATGRATEAA